MDSYKKKLMNDSIDMLFKSTSSEGFVGLFHIKTAAIYLGPVTPWRGFKIKGKIIYKKSPYFSTEESKNFYLKNKQYFIGGEKIKPIMHLLEQKEHVGGTAHQKLYNFLAYSNQKADHGVLLDSKLDPVDQYRGFFIKKSNKDNTYGLTCHSQAFNYLDKIGSNKTQISPIYYRKLWNIFINNYGLQLDVL